MREYLQEDRTTAIDAGVMALAAGSGSVRISRAGARSLVTRARAVSPLRLLMPRNHGCGAWLYTSTYGGGLVDGFLFPAPLEIAASFPRLVRDEGLVHRCLLSGAETLLAIGIGTLLGGTIGWILHRSAAAWIAFRGAIAGLNAAPTTGRLIARIAPLLGVLPAAEATRTSAVVE